jgi:Calpain family cysteine protease
MNILKLCTDAYMTNTLLIRSQQRFVLLKDVWTEGQFNGNWCKNSNRWDDSPELSAELSAHTPQQCFWMSYEDVCNVFNTVVSVNLMSSAEYEATVCGSWSVAHTTACITTDSGSVVTSTPTQQSHSTSNAATATTKKQRAQENVIDCSTWLYTQQYHIKVGNDSDATGTDTSSNSDVAQKLHTVHVAVTIEDARYHKQNYKQSLEQQTAIGFALVQRQPGDNSSNMAIISITDEHKIM